MTNVGDLALKGLDLLTPSPSAEKLVFRLFKGDAVAAVASGRQGSLKETDVETVVLKVNPAQVAFAKRKVIQKVQTSAPGRFVVFDWGSELTILTIMGNTGNLLPASVVNGMNPVFNTIESITNQLSGGTRSIGPMLDAVQNAPMPMSDHTSFGAYANHIQNLVLDTSTYYELLNMSPKYRTFKKLEGIFDKADADSDIITLEFGDMAMYRGFFEDFSFEIVAEKPWNWTYSITFVILDFLSDKSKRPDAKHTTDPAVVELGEYGMDLS